QSLVHCPIKAMGFKMVIIRIYTPMFCRLFTWALFIRNCRRMSIFSEDLRKLPERKIDDSNFG
ncbi:MAG: hypothetical protein LBV07_05225, partial [Syntrophobacterales bacterium]|nr:hypothetical protein [Syntrophobacterales bacterium]